MSELLSDKLTSDILNRTLKLKMDDFKSRVSLILINHEIFSELASEKNIECRLQATSNGDYIFEGIPMKKSKDVDTWELWEGVEN